MEIFDSAGLKDPEVEKFRNFFLGLFRPRVNFESKEKVELKTFVLEGHPSCQLVETSAAQYNRVDGTHIQSCYWARSILFHSSVF